MNRLKQIPFFLFLLPVFFCLHGGLEDFGVISFSEVLLIGFYISISLVLLFLFLFAITKNKATASLVTFYAGGFYIFFGALQDWLQDRALLSFLNRYSVLLPLFLISIFALLYFLKKKPVAYKKLFLYLNILLIIYCLLDTGLLLNRSLGDQKNGMAGISFNQQKVKARPNVYYLLFDEYPGYKSLQTAFGFKNDSLYHFLQQTGFTVLPTFSNYNFTIFSMSSIFNMQYVPDNYNHDHELTDQRDFRNRFNEIKNASVFSIYRSMGYKIENYSVFDVGNQPCINPDKSFLPVHSRVLTTKMLHNRLRKHIGWWFRGTWLQNIFIKKEAIYQADETNQDIQRMVNQSVTKNTGKPRFCYAHLIMPHSPYFRDSTGALLNESDPKTGNLTDTRYFLSYLKYSNAVISSLVNNIVKHDPSAVVVVMSDHGFRDYNHHQDLHLPAFDNICAVRFPDHNVLPYKDSWSTVNFFRYLFNCEYGQQIPYLKDSTIWLNY